MAKFFKVEKKLNVEHVAGFTVLLTAKRYRPSNKRWNVFIKSGFHPWESVKSLQGSKKEIRHFLNTELSAYS